MPKTNFSRSEKIFDQSIQKFRIENLSELALIVNMIQENKIAAIPSNLEKIIKNFQRELEILKKKDMDLFERLSLTPFEEKRVKLPLQEYTSADWALIKDIKLRIDELKKHLQGQSNFDEEICKEQITAERKRHINKRFNIREGWLPLK